MSNGSKTAYTARRKAIAVLKEEVRRTDDNSRQNGNKNVGNKVFYKLERCFFHYLNILR
jgi:hypothetical protein